MIDIDGDGALFIQVSLGAKNERYVFVSIVSTHPFWIDAKEGGEAAATQLGVKFEYTGPAGLTRRHKQLPWSRLLPLNRLEL